MDAGVLSTASSFPHKNYSKHYFAGRDLPNSSDGHWKDLQRSTTNLHFFQTVADSSISPFCMGLFFSLTFYHSHHGFQEMLWVWFAVFCDPSKLIPVIWIVLPLQNVFGKSVISLFYSLRSPWLKNLGLRFCLCQKYLTSNCEGKGNLRKRKAVVNLFVLQQSFWRCLSQDPSG